MNRTEELIKMAVVSFETMLRAQAAGDEALAHVARANVQSAQNLLKAQKSK